MPRTIWVLIIGMLINVIGSSFLWPLNMLYMVNELGKSQTIAGLVLMFLAISTAIGNMLGGYIFDRFGGYRAVMSGILISCIALAVLNIDHEWPMYPIFLMLLGFGQGIIFPAMFAMIGSTWPEGGRRAFNVCYLFQNLGVAIGTAASGFVASYSYDYAFMGNGIMYLVFCLFMFFGIRHVKTKQQMYTKGQQGRKLENRQAFRALCAISFVFLLCWFGYIQWQGTIPIYAQSIGVTLEQYSLFWTVNGAFIVFFQPFLILLLRRWNYPIKIQVLTGLAVFVISFWYTAQVSSFSDYMIAMIILTIGEMLIWPAIPTIASQLAPEGKAGIFQGVTNTFATGGRMIGPLFGGIMVDYFNIHFLFYFLIMIMVVAAVIVVFYDRGIVKDRLNSATM